MQPWGFPVHRCGPQLLGPGKEETGAQTSRSEGGRGLGAGSPGSWGVGALGADMPGLSPPALSGADTCYVLSFAVIMLNTSLHNPNVRDKPGLERFVAMNRGINEGGDLPEELLRVSPPSLPLSPVPLPATDTPAPPVVS